MKRFVSERIKYSAKMSSLQNAMKRNKTHQERHQPEARKKLGLLEKKKDYKLRAKDYNEKKKTLQELRKKALDKNPDEFYFHMINSKTVDGIHREKKKDAVLTDEQIALMQTQDIKYIVNKRTAEKHKIDKLKSSLHMTNSNDKPRNKHTFFVDGEEEKKKFDVVKHLGTHPALIGRTYNRPKMDDLRSGKFNLAVNEDDLSEIEKRSNKSYKELQQRFDREKQLGVIQEKMVLKKVLKKGKEKPVKLVKPEAKDSAPVYLWPAERKR
jgi:U3 small nucleolar RNA-associated protein 11